MENVENEILSQVDITETRNTKSKYVYHPELILIILNSYANS